MGKISGVWEHGLCCLFQSIHIKLRFGEQK